MKKLFALICLLAANVFVLTGCENQTNKDTSICVIYGVVAVLSAIPLVCGCFVAKKIGAWFVCLFASVFVANIGYFALSMSTTLSEALLANRISYLGSAFLPLIIFMIMLGAIKVNYKKWLPISLIAISVIVFLIAASPGYSTLYYKEVSLVLANDVSTLDKVYGPLHIVYTIYLLGYFVAIIATTVYAFVKKTVVDTASSIFLVLATTVNIGVWFFEQISKFEFEFLSISYLISELFLLAFVFMLAKNNKSLEVKPTMQSVSLNDLGITKDQIDFFVLGIEKLTPTERAIYNEHIKRTTTKEILAIFNIKENTLKFHNKNIYSKLGVSSRKELVQISKMI